MDANEFEICINFQTARILLKVLKICFCEGDFKSHWLILS